MHSELYTAPRQLIGGLSESTGSSGQRRRARGRECRGTQGPTMNTPRLRRGGKIASSSFILFFTCTRYWYSYSNIFCL